MQYAAHSKANVNLNNYIINIKYRQLPFFTHNQCTLFTDFQTWRWLVGWCLTAFTAQTRYCATGVWNILCRTGGQDKYTIKQWNNNQSENSKHDSTWSFWRLFGSRLPCHIRLPQTRVFLTNHLASIDNLTRTARRQNTQKHKHTQKVALINSTKEHQKPMLRETDRTWFSRLYASGQETERVCSYNTGAHTAPMGAWNIQGGPAKVKPLTFCW